VLDSLSITSEDAATLQRMLRERPELLLDLNRWLPKLQRLVAAAIATPETEHGGPGPLCRRRRRRRDPRP